jgi:HTH-type transcriptional regulator/antitoxin HigA
VAVLKIRPVKTEADYDAALASADALMDAEAGTSEADELDVLATLIEAYEDKHYPMDPPGPDRGHQVPHGAAGPDAQGP